MVATQELIYYGAEHQYRPMRREGQRQMKIDLHERHRQRLADLYGRAKDEVNPYELARLVGQIEMLTEIEAETIEAENPDVTPDKEGYVPNTLTGIKQRLSSLLRDAKVFYRQEYKKCGRANCATCSTGMGHGPYWYSYRYRNNKTIKKYVGKSLPPEYRPEIDETHYIDVETAPTAESANPSDTHTRGARRATKRKDTDQV